MTLPKKADLVLLRLQMLKDGYGHEPIDRFVDGVVAYNSLAHGELEQRRNELKSDPSFADYIDLILEIDDEHYFVDEAKKLAHELSIVALYKKIELTVGRAVKIAYPDAPDKTFYKIQNLNKFLKEKGITASLLSGYAGMNETRVLNNAIKHSGNVGKELSEFDGWIKGQPLDELDIAYRRLAPLCADYIQALLNELINKRKAAL